MNTDQLKQKAENYLIFSFLLEALSVVAFALLLKFYGQKSLSVIIGIVGVLTQISSVVIMVLAIKKHPASFSQAVQLVILGYFIFLFLFLGLVLYIWHLTTNGGLPGYGQT